MKVPPDREGRSKKRRVFGRKRGRLLLPGGSRVVCFLLLRLWRLGMWG